MPFHDVQQGETLIGLAVANGLESWQDILDRPENAELKKKRSDPGILKAGDRVFIPNRVLCHDPAAVDAKHTFKLSPPKAWLRLAVKNAAAAPYAGKKYELTVAGKTVAGDLPADGVIEQAVPVDVTTGKLVVWTDAEVSETWDLKIGYMDPIDEVSGVQARLNNLGFDCGEPDGELDDDTRAAVRAFQLLTGLEVTGDLDDALRQKLLAFYDPGQDEQQQQQVEPAADEEDSEDSEPELDEPEEDELEDEPEEDA